MAAVADDQGMRLKVFGVSGSFGVSTMQNQSLKSASVVLELD
jgi:hypothetical protein